MEISVPRIRRNNEKMDPRDSQLKSSSDWNGLSLTILPSSETLEFLPSIANPLSDISSSLLIRWFSSSSPCNLTHCLNSYLTTGIPLPSVRNSVGARVCWIGLTICHSPWIARLGGAVKDRAYLFWPCCSEILDEPVLLLIHAAGAVFDLSSSSPATCRISLGVCFFSSRLASFLFDNISSKLNSYFPLVLECCSSLSRVYLESSY